MFDMMNDLTELELEADLGLQANSNTYLPSGSGQSGKKKKTGLKSFGQKIGSKIGKKFSKGGQKDMLNGSGLGSQIAAFTE